MEPLIITLKQHTPLIHFQHDQEGATLRASEVKPKLDRFIIEKAFCNKFEKCKKYLVGYSEKEEGKLQEKFEKENFRALNYKLSLKAEKKVVTPIEEIYQKNNGQKGTISNPLYFANMGKTDCEKLLFVYNNIVHLKFFVFNLSLKKFIKNHICEFFYRTNFGSRNNKGFGSFYLSHEDTLYREPESLEKVSCIEIPTTNDKVIWETISYYYKRLKSGIPRINGEEKQYQYEKSYLKKSHEKMEWEKKFIKSIYLREDMKELENEYVFLRTVLGLPGSYTFKKGNINKDGREQFKDQIEVEIISAVIDRISSPILFKPLKKDKSTSIFIHVSELEDETYDSIKNVDFRFQLKFKFEYNELGKNGRLRKTNKLIPLGSRFEDQITESMKKNSLDPSQIERLKTFLNKKNYSQDKMCLRLPIIKISVSSLLDDYHEKELKYTFDVKCRNHQTINAKITRP